jgi:tetratricopeptide (TPR) repeat protein
VLRAVASFYLRAGQVPRAEPHLRKLFSRGLRAPAAQAAWARRNLAVALAARGDYRQFRAALSLLEDNRKLQREERDEDRYARGMVLATRPGHHRQAIELLEELAGRGSLAPEDQFLLAQLHATRGEWPRADYRMERLLLADGGNRSYLAFHARNLLRHKEVEAAQGWADKLEELHPRTWEAAEVGARLLQAQDKGTEAVARLQKLLAAQPGGPGKARAAVAVAGLLEELGHFAPAEEAYRLPEARGSPEGLLSFSAFLGRRKRFSEALDLCARAWKACPPEAVAAVCVAVVRGGAGPEHVKRVEGWLNGAVGKGAATAGLTLALANLRDLQGRYDDSEALYRRALARDPSNALALNNLAFLLALRGGKVAEATRLIDRALEHAGPEAQLLDTRAVVRLAAGQAEQALGDLRRAIAQEPAASSHFHSAQALLLAKRPPAARASLAAARARGLTADTLHPLERPAYRRLLAELRRK